MDLRDVMTDLYFFKGNVSQDENWCVIHALNAVAGGIVFEKPLDFFKLYTVM